MSFITKIKKFTCQKLCAKIHNKMLNLFGIRVYPSYWHYRIKGRLVNPDYTNCYFTAKPNSGAGIGHQMANWIAGYWYAKQFQIKFAHLPFSTPSWENFLGFGIDEPKVSELKKQGWKVRRIPIFHENNPESIQLTKDIMSTYSGKKIIFLCEQDQFYRNQYGVMKEIQDKFFHAPARKNETLKYIPSHLNIAIHVRRGDIMSDPNNENLRMRYLSNDYYVKTLKQVVDMFSKKQEKPLHIWFFSQGKPEDYPEFHHYNNFHWCLDMGAQESFLHMVYADILITSKSSFSYKPALLNRGIKVCPRFFWHGYPDTDDWILCDNDGSINNKQ